MLVVMGLGLVLALSSPSSQAADRLHWYHWAEAVTPVSYHRIIPKSIFLLPNRRDVPTCPPGLEWDANQQKCLKVFKLDQEAQKKFLIQRLQETFPAYSLEQKEKGAGAEPLHLELSMAKENVENVITKDEESVNK